MFNNIMESEKQNNSTGKATYSNLPNFILPKCHLLIMLPVSYYMLTGPKPSYSCVYIYTLPFMAYRY